MNELLFTSMRCPETDTTYFLNPPVDLRTCPQAIQKPPRDIYEVLATHLTREEDPPASHERIDELRHRLWVMAQVAPNRRAYAQQLNDLTYGKPRVHLPGYQDT